MALSQSRTSPVRLCVGVVLGVWGWLWVWLLWCGVVVWVVVGRSVSCWLCGCGGVYHTQWWHCSPVVKGARRRAVTRRARLGKQSAKCVRILSQVRRCSMRRRSGALSNIRPIRRQLRRRESLLRQTSLREMRSQTSLSGAAASARAPMTSSPLTSGLELRVTERGDAWGCCNHWGCTSDLLKGDSPWKMKRLLS